MNGVELPRLGRQDVVSPERVPTETMKAKICLVGEPAVGKSSLVRRFVFDQWDSRYQPTLGAKVTKREVKFHVGDRPIHAILTIWDIMGEPSFRELLREAYFSNIQGILAVGDVTRASTISAVSDWISAASRVSGPVPVVVLASKNDLDAEADVRSLLNEVGNRWDAPRWFTSAKTGENVDLAFFTVADQIARQGLRRSATPSDP